MGWDTNKYILRPGDSGIYFNTEGPVSDIVLK